MNNNLSIIQTRGKEVFGEHFCVFPEDHEVLQKLLTWFLQDEQGAKHYNINLHKGILLTGPIGCGKTSLMSLMRLLVPQPQRFGIKSCREITFDFIKDGYFKSPASFPPRMEEPQVGGSSRCWHRHRTGDKPCLRSLDDRSQYGQAPYPHDSDPRISGGFS